MLKLKRKKKKDFQKFTHFLSIFNNKNENNNVSFTLGMLAIT